MIWFRILRLRKHASSGTSPGGPGGLDELWVLIAPQANYIHIITFAHWLNYVRITLPKQVSKNNLYVSFIKKNVLLKCNIHKFSFLKFIVFCAERNYIANIEYSIKKKTVAETESDHASPNE